MNKAPEQSIVDQLEAASYNSEAIIAYLEARVDKEWSQMDYAECGPGEKMVFGVCRKVGGATEEEKPEVGPDGKPKEKQKKQQKSPMEEKLEKAAKAQGSDATNNKKVMIDGKAYGWAIQNGKPIMVAWGSVAGEKKVGPKKKKEEKPKEKEEKPVNRAAIEAQIKTQEANLEKQVNEAGRAAIQKQIDELKKKLQG